MGRIAQIPTIIIPTAGTGTLTIADALQHTSLEFESWQYQEKRAAVIAVLAGAPGALQGWVEQSSTGAAGSWVMLGVPVVLVATGAFNLIWTAHSQFVRVVLQVPIFGAGGWVVSVVFEADLKP